MLTEATKKHHCPLVTVSPLMAPRDERVVVSLAMALAYPAVRSLQVQMWQIRLR